MTAKFINRRLVTIEPVRNFRRTVPKPTTSNGLKPAGEFPAKNRDLGTGLSSELLPVNRDPASQPLRQADDGIAKSPTQRLPMTAILAPARKFAEGEIESLAESLSIATQTSAILVARTDSGQHEIICGNARFAAAQALNWREIDAVVVEGDEDARKLMRIADNLHRRKMTKLDRARQIDLWCQLACEVSQVDTPGGQQPHERGLAKAKGKLGISKSDAARCRTIARLTPPAATTAVYLKLANNGRALLSAAVCATEEEQMACLRAFAEQKNNAKTNRRSMKRSAGTGPEVPAAASGAGVEHSVPQSTRQLDAELQIPPILDRRNPDVHFDRLLRLWRDFRSQLDNAPEAARDRFVRETLTAEDPLLKRLLPSCAQTGAEV